MQPTVTANQLNPWLAQSVVIQRMTQETPETITYDLVFENAVAAREYSFAPGQFNMLYLPGLGEIAISISGDPGSGEPGSGASDRVVTVPHTIRSAGNVTRALADLSPGASIGLRGPFGSSWPIQQCADRDVILVAGGIGLAPLRPAIYQLLAARESYRRLVLLVGARDPATLLFTAEYDSWRARGLDVQITVDRPAAGWNGNLGMVTTLLNRIPLNNPQNTLLMTCGPEVMMWYTVQTALNRGLRPDLQFVSLERNMNCAIGLCGHCQLGPEFLCKDGPVFAYDRVASIMKVEDL